MYMYVNCSHGHWEMWLIGTFSYVARCVNKIPPRGLRCLCGIHYNSTFVYMWVHHLLSITLSTTPDRTSPQLFFPLFASLLDELFSFVCFSCPYSSSAHSSHIVVLCMSAFCFSRRFRWRNLAPYPSELSILRVLAKSNSPSLKLAVVCYIILSAACLSHAWRCSHWI